MTQPIELKQAAQQALEVLENAPGGCGFLWQIKANEAIAALRTAIQQAEAKTDEPVAWLDEMLADTKEVFDANGNETPQVVRDVIEYVASWITVYNEKRRAVENASGDLTLRLHNSRCDQRAAIVDAAMTAAQAQKG